MKLYFSGISDYWKLNPVLFDVRQENLFDAFRELDRDVSGDIAIWELKKGKFEFIAYRSWTGWHSQISSRIESTF